MASRRLCAVTITRRTNHKLGGDSAFDNCSPMCASCARAITPYSKCISFWFRKRSTLVVPASISRCTHAISLRELERRTHTTDPHYLSSRCVCVCRADQTEVLCYDDYNIYLFASTAFSLLNIKKIKYKIGRKMGPRDSPHQKLAAGFPSLFSLPVHSLPSLIINIDKSLTEAMLVVNACNYRPFFGRFGWRVGVLGRVLATLLPPLFKGIWVATTSATVARTEPNDV